MLLKRSQNGIACLFSLLSSLVGFGQTRDSLQNNYQTSIRETRTSPVEKLVDLALSGNQMAGIGLMDSLKASGDESYTTLTTLDHYFLETLFGRHDSLLAIFRGQPSSKYRYFGDLELYYPRYKELIFLGLSDTLFRTKHYLTDEDKAFIEYLRQRIYERYIWLFDEKRPEYAGELHRNRSDYQGVNALSFVKKHPDSQYNAYLKNIITFYESISFFCVSAELSVGPWALFNTTGLKTNPDFSSLMVVSLFTKRWAVGGGFSSKFIKSPIQFFYGLNRISKGTRVALVGGILTTEYRFPTIEGRSLSLVSSYRIGHSTLFLGKTQKGDSDSTLNVGRGYDISLGLKRGWSFGWVGEKGRGRWDFGVFALAEIGYFHPVSQVHGFYVAVAAGIGWYFGKTTSRISRSNYKSLLWGPVPEKLELVPQKPWPRNRPIY